MKASFFCGILILFFYSTSFSQKDTEFWFVAPEVTSTHGDNPVYLRLTSFEEASDVKISQPANPSFSINIFVPAHGTYSVDLTPYLNIIENKPANQVNPYGLLVQSSTPITAYYDEANDWNTDIFALKGKNSLGKEFYIPMQNSFSNASRFSDAHNSFDVVATENNTTVWITPSNDIVGHPKGIPFRILLNRGETFSCVATGQSSYNHLYGSKVSSDKPIAVTVKDDSVDINGGLDLNGDQIVPTNVIGREYIIVRGYLASNVNDRVYVISAADNNRIYINGNTSPAVTLNKGEIYSFTIPEANPIAYVRSDNPVYVQHLTGFDTESGSALLPPVRCTGSREVAFTRSTQKRLSLTIVTEDGAQGSFEINSNSSLIPASQFSIVPGTSNPAMVYARISYTVSQVSYGPHIITNNKANFHVGIIQESNLQGCSYGYFSDYSDLYIGPDATICSGTSKILDAGAGKQSYEWNTGETTQTITVSKPGTYRVTTNSSGCVLHDTIVITTIPSPVIDAGPVDSVDQATSVILLGTAYSGSSTMTYQWTPQSSIISGGTTLTPTTVKLTKDIVFKLQAIDKNGCSTSDSVKIFVDPGPCAKGHILNNDTVVCPGSIVELYSKPVLTYQWLPSNLVNNSTAQNPWLVIDSTRTLYLYTTEYARNLVKNPDFELGNTGFVTDYTYCDGNNCLWPMGDYGYSVGTDASYYLNTYFSGLDHTTGSGNFMMINGGSPTLKVWQQTIPVTPNTQYTFGAWVSRLSDYDTAIIRFSINGAQLGAIYTVSASRNKWEQVFRTWNSGSQATAKIEIVDLRPVETGNDFGLDDIFFGEIISCSDSITITASQNVSLGHDTIIAPGQVLDITPLGGPFNQYSWNTGDTTQSISIHEAGKYSLLATDQIGCESRDTINVKSSNSFVVFPNAFTPNADGDNDVFRPMANNVVKFHLAIYNRWGQLLFESDDAETGWTGITGEKGCPAGLYVYVATYEFKYLGETNAARGSFSLLK
jgi:gliding motility-associated-like protein